MTSTDALVGLAILVGIAGIVIPLLPGTLLILGALLVWAVLVSTSTGWVVFAVAAVVLVAGAVAKYAVPHSRMSEAGVPTRTMMIGGCCALVGLFVIPYVGLLIGFVLGIYLAEVRRLGAERAWPSTKHALKAVGLSILIELTAALLATVTWTVGVVLT